MENNIGHAEAFGMLYAINMTFFKELSKGVNTELPEQRYQTDCIALARAMFMSLEELKKLNYEVYVAVLSSDAKTLREAIDFYRQFQKK